MQVVSKKGMHLKQWTWMAGMSAVVAIGAPAYGADAEAVMKGLSGVEVKGYVEAQYNYNFNDPVTQTNAFRVFDTSANAFTFNMAELSLMKSSDAGTGFGLVLNYGLDADLIASAPVFTTATVSDFNVQQAFITQKVLGGMELKFGKYATLAGAEVIEGPNNYNISRSYLFGLAIPFTHTGVRASTSMGALSAVLGLNNGWDLMNDNNKGKTLEAQVGLTPMDMLSAYITGYYGPEVTDATVPDSDARSVVDIVATLKPMDGLAVVFNYDRGSQADAGGAGTGSALWQGYALYANLGLGEKHAVTLRGEVFDDQDGFRTGTAQTLREITLTFSSKAMENLEWRAELRHDESNQDVFSDDQGPATEDAQNTVAVAAYYTF
jgi:hypothetical protein